MTAIIDTNFNRLSSYGPNLQNFPQNSAHVFPSKDHRTNSFAINTQNCFTVTLQQGQCPYGLLFTLNTTHPVTLIKIHLLKSNGNLLKITEQESKTYLIRKFIQFNDIYSPRIDPNTGAIYFEISYLKFKLSGSASSKYDMNILFNNLNQEKLNQSIQKFSLFYQNGQQGNQTDTDFETKKKYQQLSKTICAVNDSDLMQILSINQLTKHSFHAQNPQHMQKKLIISQLKRYVLSQKITPDFPNKQKISNQIKQIEFEASNLSALTKRRKGKSNYETLLVNHSTQKQIQQTIFKMVETKIFRTTLKVVESEMGRITLNIEKVEEAAFREKMRFLNQLPKNIEYHFLDQYYKHSEILPVIISLSLKEESINRYLLNNAHCISLETKMRIMLQICSAVHILWEERNIILNVNSFKKMHITKNLTVKLRNLESFHKVDPHMLLEEKGQVNLRLLDNWLNLSEIYFKLFFGYDMGYLRPTVNCQVGIVSTEYLKAKTMWKRAVGVKLVPDGFKNPRKDILLGLNYIFLAIIDKARKAIGDKNVSKQQSNMMSLEKGCGLEGQDESQSSKKLLSYKLMCCWLFKNFEMISKDQI